MRRIFADAVYWVAIANRKDQWYTKVVTVMRLLGRGQHHPEITGLVGTPTLGARQLTPDSIVRSIVGGMREGNGGHH